MLDYEYNVIKKWILLLYCSLESNLGFCGSKDLCRIILLSYAGLFEKSRTVKKLCYSDFLDFCFENTFTYRIQEEDKLSEILKRLIFKLQIIHPMGLKGIFSSLEGFLHSDLCFCHSFKPLLSQHFISMYILFLYHPSTHSRSYTNSRLGASKHGRPTSRCCHHLFILTIVEHKEIQYILFIDGKRFICINPQCKIYGSLVTV